MAPKKATTDDDALEIGDNSAELDQAIDDLRGVLKADSDGAPEIGDIGADFPMENANPDFGGDFGSETETAETGLGEPMAQTEDTTFGGGMDFEGNSDFGGGDFEATSFEEPAFGGVLPGSTPTAGSGMQQNLDMIMDIPIDVQIILGSSRMQVSSLMNLNEGAIISLDRRIGEPVDLTVNGRLIGRGEITVMEDDETRFGIRLIEVKSVAKS